MADETATATPEAPQTREFNIPVEGAAPRTFKIPIEGGATSKKHAHNGREFTIPIEQPAAAKPEPAKEPEPVYPPTWWGGVEKKLGMQPQHLPSGQEFGEFAKETVKAFPKFMAGLAFGGGTATSGPPTPTTEGVQASTQQMVQEQAASGDPNAKQVLEQEKFLGTPNINISGTGQFQKIFDPKSKKWYSRGTTGFVKAIENQTSFDNLYGLATIYAAPENLAKPIGLVFQGQLLQSGVEGVAGAVEARKDKDDEGAQYEAWGNLFGNAAVVVGMHYSHTGYEKFKERDNTAILDSTAQDLYETKFSKLTNEQKTNVLYQSLENSDPKFKKRVDAEVARLRAKQGTPALSQFRHQKSEGGINAIGPDPRAVRAAIEAVKPTTAEQQQQRLDAAKKLVKQMLVAKARREAYQRQAQTAEAEARRADIQRQAAENARQQAARFQGEADRESDRAAQEATSQEQRRGYPVEESRTAENLPVTGLRKTTERESGQRYDPEQPEPAIPVTERRAVPDIPLEPKPEVLRAEAKMQELAEDRMGQSFSTLPLSRQMVAARWMERFQPEAWAAFQGTPAHQTFTAHVEMAGMADAALKHYMDRNATGESQTLAPGADVHTGMARLILDRTDIASALKADPATARDLNEHAEKSMGRSFDSLAPEDRKAALSEYLRDKPEKLQAFLTPDLAERIQSGQHIDLANMEDELRNHQQAQMLMEFRDQIRQDMDQGLSRKLVTEEKAKREKELTDTLYSALTGREPSLENVHAVSRDMTREASDLGLGTVNGLEDLFRIEKAVKDTADSLRTPKMRAFLNRMNQVRFAAETHILKALADATVDSFLSGGEDAEAKAAKQVIEFSGKAQDLQQAADNLRAQGRAADADAAQDAANGAKAKADAVEAGASIANNPPPPAALSKPLQASVGRETRVVSPRNESGAPAHYAIVEAHDLQTSHLPQTFETRPGYDQNGQPRDYSTDKDAQTAVATRAANLDLDVLLSNGVTTMEGPAIVDQRGHVISGNGRTLSLLTADEGEFGRYRQGLHDRAVQFGIDPAEVLKYKNPILVKVLDSPVESGAQWALMGKDLNDSPARGISGTDLGVALANMLSPENVERLSGIIESLPSDVTVREAMRARSADIAQFMVDTGAIAPNRMVEFVDAETGQLKEKAKDLFENMLAGFTVTDKAVLDRSSASTKDRLTRAGLSFIRMRNAGENWNLASMNTDAVRLLSRAEDAASRLSHLVPREAGSEKIEGSLIERYLHPERFMDRKGFGPTGSLSFDGQPLHGPVHAGVEALAMALEESPKKYANLMAGFADNAEGMQQSMFGAEHPADAFTNEIANQYGLKVIPEEWGSVTGFSDEVKAAIEDGRGPLPVEPAEHTPTAVAAVTPDSSSVTDVIPEGPKTVQDLRKALETHPNISPEEAQALTEMFEDVLPRAIGESLTDILGNRRLTIKVGGEEKDELGIKQRGYHEILEDGRAIVALCDIGDQSTFLHEMAHYIRRYLNPADQAVANSFVGAKPGEEWTAGPNGQEEKFAQAFERYHYDGGIRRGKLEKVFATISRAMQSIYNAVTGKRLAKGTPELNAMFDKWYDWNRSERKPITARLDVDAVTAAANGKVEVPEGAKVIGGTINHKPSANATVHVFLDEDSARDAIRALGDKKTFGPWELLRVKGESTVYLRADARKGKKLFQASLNETIELARKAKELEARLKRETDPREQARLRGALNGIEDKLKGATGIIGGTPEPRDTSVINLVHGMGEMPRVDVPTTPAQATTVQQVFGDPTATELGGERARPKRTATHEATGEGQGGADRVPEPTGAANGKHAPIAEPAKDPLAKVKAAKLAESKVARGTPVVAPDIWRQHVEDLGLPTGTPPPTVRLASDIRDLMIYPGQSEAVEGALSALQQYDATVLASGAGTGKTYMLSAIAENLLGTGGDKVGLLVTRSQNLIHEADGFVDTARKLGVDVESLPSKIGDVQTGGMYAATYSGIRGNRDILTIPWDFVLFDESGEAANWTESEQGKAVVLLGHAAKKVVYSSATSHSTVMELGYMHKLGLWPKGGFFEWAQQFGLREVGPNTYAGGGAAKKLEKLRQQLIERGQWQQLYKSMEGTEAHAVLVPQTPEVREGVRSIRTAFAMAKNAFIRAGMSKYITPTAGHESIYLKRFISGARLNDAIKLGQQAVKAGWTPVFFTEYRSPAEEGMDFFHNLPGDLGVKINKMLPPLPDVVKAMRTAFGTKVGIFAGEANEARATELEEMHLGNKDALYMTYAAGGVGANAQDKVGDKPRFGIFIDMPWSGKMLEQGSNRTWRYASQSGVVNVFMTSDTLPEMKLLATKVLPRMRSLKAAVFGEKNESSLSKKLRDAAGIPEELLQYEHGEEAAPQAAEFEQDGDGAQFSKIDEYQMPDVSKFKNKPMEYKGRGKKLYQGPIDRRQNSALRKRIAEMTPDELRKTLLSSDVVDLPNGRAFDEAERDKPAAAVAMSDADGLKAFNDKFGYTAGDALLKAKGEALKEAGLEAYHEKGDEFLYRGESADDLKAKLDKAREILRNKTFDVTADGKQMQLKGVDFSYGTGTNLHEAEAGLHEHKSEREGRGERRRGELGGITEVQKGTDSTEQAILNFKQEGRRLLAEGVTAYASGVNRAADLEGFAKAGVPIGLDVSRISPDMVAKIKELDTPVFVDSGAFGEMEFGPEGPKQTKPISDAEWERRIGIYKDLAETLGDKATVVAPDMVGNQEVTMERLKKFGKDIRELKDMGARVVVPLQIGDMDLGEIWLKANDAVGLDVVKPGEHSFLKSDDYTHEGMIPAFPMKKAATSPASVVSFIKEFKPPSIHLLGMGASNRIADALIKILHKENPGMEITMDSNVLRAHVGEGRSVTESQRSGTGRSQSITQTFEGKKIGGQHPRTNAIEGRTRLYQGPKDEDPFQKAANDAWEELMGRTAKLPAKQERVITANQGAIKAEASEAGRRAMRTGEPVEEAVKRKTRDMENEALIWLDDMKDQKNAGAHFVKSTVWMFGTSGDKAVEAICKDAGFAKDGAELRRRIIDYDLRSGNYRGELGGMIEKIIYDNKLRPADLETVSKVVENQATSDDPRIQKAATDFRKFTAYVRKRLANSGLSVVFYTDKGQRAEVPYSQIADDPNYWPRIYDWQKKFALTDPKTGKVEITSLGKIMDMPTSSERRENFIEQFAKQKGISKMKAQLFFDKNARGIRLAGNVERAREYELPMYGRDRKALDRYVNEVAEKLAAAEVHGQFREKTDAIIDQLPDEKTRKLVNHVITADLNPSRLHDSDRFFLRQANRWLVLSKMSLSALKLPFHLAKTSLATNTRSVVHAMLQGVTSPKELRRNAVDCGAMSNYIKQAWMREYGMKTGGLDQKMLDFNGFTAVLNFSRVISAGAGRLWFEKYAYPELKKNPGNPVLRRKLNDLYGMSNEQMDKIAANGYGPQDVKRMELGAANWTTGSGRPTELPPALRGTTGDPLYDRLTTLLRISQSLHGFMFKTANLVNRTVWHELYQSDFKSPAPYQLIARFSANFGLAGLALHELLNLRHQMSGSPEADMEKRRKEWIDAHPMSKEALFSAFSDITMGLGIDVLTQFFDELATHDQKDKQKLVQQERTLNAARDLVIGVFPNDVYTAAKAMKDYQATFEDTGKHQMSPEDRRKQIRDRLLNEEIPVSRYVVKPTKVTPRAFPKHRGHAASALQ